MVIMVSPMMVMAVITAEAEKTALVGTVWPVVSLDITHSAVWAVVCAVVRIDVTHFPGITVSVAGIVA